MYCDYLPSPLHYVCQFIADDDYMPLDETLVFTDSEMMCVPIYIINDTLIEAEEEFSIELTVIGYPSETNVEIDEDEKDIIIISEDGNSIYDTSTLWR